MSRRSTASSVEDSRSTPTISSVIAGLHSTRPNKVYNALVLVRTHFLKEKDGVAKLRQHGGLELIIDILRQHEDRVLDVALSILGNCCLEKETRVKVQRLHGIPVLAEILLKTKKSHSIRNRACRTLANLSTDPQCCCAIHQVETLVATIATSLVTMGDDHECQQTYIRALRLFADTPGHHKAVLEASGLKCVCDVFKSTSKAVLTAALKTAAHLTEECTDECIRQLLLSDAPAQLVTLTSDPETAIHQLAWSRLLAFSKHEPLRLALGSAGAVALLVARVRRDCDWSSSHRLTVVNALCHYCQEAVNRIRVRDDGGLEMMLTLLGRTDYSLIHNRLISALVCFLYDETSIETLLQNGLVAVLVGHLRRCAHISESTADTGLGLSDDECADLILPNPDPEEEPTQQDWLTGGNPDGQATELTSRDDDVIESVSRCEINYKGDDEGAEDMVECDNSESEVEAAFSDISSCAASVGMLDPLDGVRAGYNVDTSDQMVNINAHCSESSTSHAASDQAMVSAQDVAKPSMDVVASEGSDAGLSCAMSAASPVRSQTKEGSVQDESEEETIPGPRYSIDSPTYKAVTSWRTETPYSGPRNIMESIEYYGSASPGGLYGYYSPPRWSPYSPMSTTSYPSPVVSPESSPQRADSPSALDIPFLSTYPTTFSGGTSPVHGTTSQLDWSPDGGMVQQAATPADFLEWSPVQQSSEHAAGSDTVAESEAAGVTDSTATVELVRRHSSSDVFRLAQSCSAQSPNDDETRRVDDSLLTCPHDRNEESRRSNAVDVPCSLPAADAACTVDDKPDVDGAISAVSGSRGAAVKSTGQRKRSFAPDTISKIRKIVDASAPNSLVDIGDLMTRGRGDTEPTPPDAYDRHRQPGKVTEHNILILLSRVSYMTDPSAYLLGGDALRGLLQYASVACLPLSRGARILQRVTRNPHCFEPIIRALIPSHIDRILGRKQPVERERRQPVVGDVGNVAKQLFQAECSPVQCLGWEAGEAPPNVGTDSSKKYIAMDADVSSQIPVASAVSERNTGGMNSKSGDVKNKCAQTSRCLELTETVRGGDTVTEGDTVTGSDGRDVSNDTTELKRCLLTNLSLLSESRYGRGVISHILLTGCSLDKLKIAISLPFLCRSRELRRKMLLEFRGLSLLLRSLADPTTAVFPATVHSLSYLTVSLGLRVHRRHQQQGWSQQTSDDATSRSPADVTFVMDDGSHVPGWRDRLALKSSVFAAMLEGHYSESGQSHVRIPHVSSRAFRVLVDCLQTDGDREEGANLAEVLARVSPDAGGSGETAGGSDVDPMHTDADVPARPHPVGYEKTATSGDHRTDMDTLLDVLILSNQYLLPGLQHQVSLLLCRRYVTRDSVERVLRLALLHNSAWLAQQCVRYALAYAMSRWERVTTMRSLLGPADMSDTIAVVRDVLISAISG